jgi:xanthine/CO dehydrogenase XdhC/CoxF family maturation factor
MRAGDEATALRRTVDGHAWHRLPCGGTIQLAIEPLSAASRIPELLQRLSARELVARCLALHQALDHFLMQAKLTDKRFIIYRKVLTSKSACCEPDRVVGAIVFINSGTSDRSEHELCDATATVQI